MEMPEIEFEAQVWLYQATKAAWHFVTLPPKRAQQLLFYAPSVKAGWGSIPVNVRIGQTVWQTSIFPDTKNKTYILPLKKEVRKAENINLEDTITIGITPNL